MSAVKIFMKTIIDSEPWLRDPSAVRKEWSQKEYELYYHGGGKEPLCFGIMWDNGIVRPSPPLIRAMEMTKEALQRKGHKGKKFARFVDPRSVNFSYMQSSTGNPINPSKCI
jgi:amidase